MNDLPSPTQSAVYVVDVLSQAPTSLTELIFQTNTNADQLHSQHADNTCIIKGN